MRRQTALFTFAALSSACFSSQLDELAAGAFACGKDAGDAPCPDGQTCSSNRCETDDTLPTVTIGDPVDGRAATFVEGGPDIDQTVQFSIGNFELVDPNVTSEHVFGQGSIIVSVDGEIVQTLTSGSVTGGREVGVVVPNVVGAHRISVRLMRNDGTPYDHAAATERNLFWLSDGQPRVAVTSPWPGEVFSLDQQEIEVKLGVVNFELLPAEIEPALGQGHAHVHYDKPFPECPELDDGCDSDYIVIVDSPINETNTFAVPSEGAVAILPPEASAREVEITAILRHLHHLPYRLPDQGEGVTFPPMEGDIVFDSITISRQ